MNLKIAGIISLIILVVSTAAVAQKKAVQPADPTKGVRDVFDRLIEGIKTADPEKTMSVYENSPRILFFNNNGSVTQGWDEMKRQRAEAYSKLKNVTLDVTGLRIEMLSPSAAYLTCKWKQSQENEGKLESASGRMTLVFQKIGKDWKVVHLHTSPDNPPANRPVMPSEKLPLANDKPPGV